MDVQALLALLADPEFVLSIIGGGSAVAAFLRNVLPHLEDLAAKTPTDADNVAVAWLSNALRLFTALLDAAKKLADAVGLNPKPAKPHAADDTVELDVDGDKSSDGSL